MPIGYVRSTYAERHGTPQQGAAETTPRPARLELDPERCPPESLRDLEGMDYIWVLAFFHRSQGYRATVVPPRGPKVPRSLFATRAPHRPNAIGLSAVRLVRVEGTVLHIEGSDLLDGTPILDVKPYVPYADAFPNARAGWIDTIDPSAPQRVRKPSARHLRKDQERAEAAARAARALEAAEPADPDAQAAESEGDEPPDPATNRRR